MTDHTRTTDRSSAHSTFTLERTYPADPARVFAAWADPATKAHWMAGPDASLEADFRVGGRERIDGRPPGGPDLVFESVYHDIVADRRIVFSSTMSIAGGPVTTVSVTTVDLEPVAAGTRLVLTQQGTYLDGHEEPEWRERGTADQLDALGGALAPGA